MIFPMQLLLSLCIAISLEISFLCETSVTDKSLLLDGAMEQGLIEAVNEMLGADCVIPMNEIENAENRGDHLKELDMNNVFEQLYQQMTDQSDEETLGEPDKFQIIIETMDNRPITMWVNSETKVENVKLKIHKNNRGPPIHDQRLKFKEKQIEDWQTMAECGISGAGGVTPVLRLLLRLRGGGFARYYLNPEYFDPNFNRDFRNEKDDGTVYYRGKHIYKRPYGSMRYAIKVLDKYRRNSWLGKEGIRPNDNEQEQTPITNDHHPAEIAPASADDGDDANKNESNILSAKHQEERIEKHTLNPVKESLKERLKTWGSKILGTNLDNSWLGEPGYRQDTDEEEWPVAYHGTKEKNLFGILMDGFRLDKCRNFAYGKGIYTTPDPEVALSYATQYEYKDKMFKMIIQTRVNPKKFKSVQTSFDADYWILPNGRHIRPYGICVYELKFNGLYWVRKF